MDNQQLQVPMNQVPQQPAPQANAQQPPPPPPEPQPQPPGPQQQVIQIGPNDIVLQQPIHEAIQVNQPLFGQLVGTLVPFEPNGRLSFSGWLQLFENFCAMNGIPPEPVDVAGNPLLAQNVRRMLFIQHIGARAFEEIRRACLPMMPHQRPIPVMCNIVREAFEPIGLVEANRMKFANLVQREGQSAQSFCNALQVAAENCQFGLAYSMTLKSRLLAGMRDDRLRETLLAQSLRLDYSGTKSLFLQMDAAKQQSQALARAVNVHAVGRQPTPHARNSGSGQRRGAYQRQGRQRRDGHPQGRADTSRPPSRPAAAPSTSCWRCGNDHAANLCPARNWSCFNCKKKGHTARKCSKSKVNRAEDEDLDQEVDQVFNAMQRMGERETELRANLNSTSDNLSEDIVIGFTEAQSNNTLPVTTSSFVETGARWFQLTWACLLACFMRSPVQLCSLILSLFALLLCFHSTGSVQLPLSNVSNLTVARTNRNNPLFVSLLVSDVKIQFEVDTGAGVTLCPQSFFENAFKSLRLQPSALILQGVSGPIKVVGQVLLKVENPQNHISSCLPLVVCESKHLPFPLLGRNWLDVLFPAWRDNWLQPIANVASSVETVMSTFREKYPNVFSNDATSAIQGYSVKLMVKPGASPVFLKPYALPYKMLDKVSSKLLLWEKEGKIQKVDFSEWASPIFAVPKKDDIRVVVDLKKVNLCLQVPVYSFPRCDDIFSTLNGGNVFCVIDLTEAYTQLKLHPLSQFLLTINTHQGLYRFTRLCYGVSSAPALFQQFIDSVLQGIPKTCAYFDDILIQGHNVEECVSLVDQVLARLSKFNVRLNQSKCVWFKTSVEYLGHVVSAKGRSPSPSLSEAIVKAPVPSNVKQLRSFLGLLNFYSPFLPSASTLLKPLRKLTEQSVDFVWSAECQKAFENAKSLLLSSNLLVHFNPALEIIVHTDASPVGVACVLNHKVNLPDGTAAEKPVLFASCSLTATQQRYSQLDREALAIVFAVNKLRKFLWGRTFTLVTDNQPIKHIFAPDKSIPIVSSMRLQHWAAILSDFRYRIEHRKANFLSVADALSRLPLPNVHMLEINYESVFNDLPLNVDIIVEESKKDAVLSKILLYTIEGWPDRVHSDPVLTSYYKIRHSFSIEKDSLLFANRVVVPLSLQKRVLELLHFGHPGVVRMKLLARSICWWLSINTDIETFCQHCEPCAVVNFKATDSVTYPWPQSKVPFQRVHVDFYQFKSVNFFLYVDSFSKWMFVTPMSVTNAENVISTLWKIFAFWGLPLKIISDNGPPFTSQAYKSFCTSLDIQLGYSPVQHAESNAVAERSVQICKKLLRKLAEENQKVAIDKWADILNKFLFAYLNTPSTTLGKSPNQVLLSYAPRTMLTNLHPKFHTSPLFPSLPFRETEMVLIKIGSQPVMKGTVVRPLSATRYLVSVEGVLKTVHLNQMSYAP